MPNDRLSIAARARTTRSKTTNGSQLLENIDGRSPAGRRYRDLVESFTRELGEPGGPTAAQQAMVKQLAGVILHAEQLQAGIVRGEHVDLDGLVRLSNLQARLLKALDLGQAKAASRRKTLADHLASRPAA